MARPHPAVKPWLMLKLQRSVRRAGQAVTAATLVKLSGCMARLTLLKACVLPTEQTKQRQTCPSSRHAACTRKLHASASDSDAMLQVFVGVRDPNPLVNNAGVDTLTRAGIDVVYIGGEEERECYDINADFMARMSHK